MISRSPRRTRFAAFAALSLAALTALSFFARVASADDLADEADLQFNLGAERYRAADFRGALEHFLASNRLVPNRNVVFNIARAYEQLKLYPDAYRYYTQALDGETDPKTRKEIEDGRTRIAENVAVLNVVTTPPGATIYINRKDLGPRGSTPRTLALPPGTYKVLAELPGYEPAESAPLEVRVGRETPVTLALTQILGVVSVAGQPAGAQIRVDRDDGAEAGVVPCELPLTPGHHTLFVSKDGFQSIEMSVDVPPRGRVAVRPKLAPVTGNVVVSSDVRDALVEIDGEPKGFAPTVLLLPVGPHKVRVSMAGFRAVEQDLVVRADSQARVDMQLTQVDEVNAASRVSESVEDAPSSVTIISSQELRAMGYPTIAEALRGVRGMYISDDRSYASVGVRGFGRLGDYGNRVLILIDGQPTNDNYIWSSYVGFDGRTDLDDVERIEIVRGPGSVLYGTSAFSGVINLVTRSREAKSHGEVALSQAGDGVGRARATAHVKLGADSGFWTSVAGAHAGGRTFFFPEYVEDTPPTVAGYARNVDGFDAATWSGRVWYKAFTAQWFLHSRKKTLPTGGYGELFADPRNTFADTRGLVEGRFEPQLSPNVQLLTRAFANLYSFSGTYAYSDADGGVERDQYTGEWAGLEQRVIYTPIEALRITAGGEVQRHFKTHQQGRNDQQIYIDRSDPFSVGAAYVVGDLTPSRFLKISAGARLDSYSTFGSSINPRLAFIVKPRPSTNIKIMGGKAFRAPSVYELYYTGANQLTPPAGSLKPEEIYSGEIEVTQRFSSTITATVAAYTNYVRNLIVLSGGGTEADPNMYANSVAPVMTMGAEAEIKRDFRQGLMLSLTYSLQHSRYVDNVDGLRHVPNSPTQLGSLKAAVPILARTLQAMTRLTVEGPRFDRYEAANDPAQGKTDASVIWDAVLSGEAEKVGVKYALGIYNAFDTKMNVPLSVEFRQRTLVQSGRTFYLSGTYSF